MMASHAPSAAPLEVLLCFHTICSYVNGNVQTSQSNDREKRHNDELTGPMHCKEDEGSAVPQAVRTAEIAMRGVMRSSAPGSIFSGDLLWGRPSRAPTQLPSAGQSDADEDSRHLHRRLLGGNPDAQALWRVLCQQVDRSLQSDGITQLRMVQVSHFAFEVLHFSQHFKTSWTCPSPGLSSHLPGMQEACVAAGKPGSRSQARACRASIVNSSRDFELGHV